jgi:hypothetical protein
VSNWRQWHQDYDDPASSLSGRLRVVRRFVGQALVDRPEPIRLISLCAGDGRDSIPVISESGRCVDALLVELDPVLADGARSRARGHDLDITVRTADAGDPANFDGFAPASIFLLCGIFGNISDADIDQTIRALPSYLSQDAVVIWTRGDHEVDGRTTELPASERVRQMFTDADFREIDFTRPDDTFFRVGMHRWPHPTGLVQARQRLFTFLW